MQKKGFGVNFITIISKEQDRVIGLVLVDNSDIPEDNLKIDTIEIKNIAERMQELINT